MRTIDQMVQQEILCCMSSVVGTLANGHGLLPTKRHGLVDGADELGALCEQAFELSCPVDDWEGAAEEAGWTFRDGFFMRGEGTEDRGIADDAREACEQDDLGPHEREIFEHWAVSDWLADELEAHGERVDRDFANLNVWARTTTGQAISMDWVIERIYADAVARYNAPDR